MKLNEKGSKEHIESKKNPNPKRKSKYNGNTELRLNGIKTVFTLFAIVP